jgi:hypothetical protein
MSIRLNVQADNINMVNINLGNTFTLEMWLYVTFSQFANYKILDISSGGVSIRPLHISYNNISTFRISNGIVDGVSSYTTPISFNTWNHIALVRTPYGGRYYEYLYLNGTIAFIYSDDDAIKYNLVNISIHPSFTIVMFMYNFKLIKSLLYGAPESGASFSPSVLLPVDFNIYLLVVYTKVNLNVITGGDTVPNGTYIVASAGSSTTSTILSYLTTVNNAPTGANFPHATICFVSGTPVLTDNSGYVSINELIPGVHAIGGQPILTVTQSITPERYLVNIPKNSLGYDVPSVDTTVSINHKILVNGDMTEAGKLVKFNPEISFVNYNQEVLYNVVLPTHGTMTVNNMTVETLNPEFLIAKMFVAMNSMNQEQRDNVVKLHNEYIKTIVGGRQTNKK